MIKGGEWHVTLSKSKTLWNKDECKDPKKFLKLRMKEVEPPKSAAPPAGVCLVVSNLSYDPEVSYLPLWTGVMTPRAESVSALRNITFSAPAGKVTAIMSNVAGERRTLIDLLAGRRKRGAFDGHVLLSGCDTDTSASASSGATSTMADHVAFVPRATHYIAGLTFIQTIRYAAQLRLKFPLGMSGQERSRAIEERVSEVLALMDLKHCKNRTLVDEAATRGELGGDLRRLSIAVEIVALPAVIIVDDPQMALDPGTALGIFAALRSLAQLGHVVVVSIPKPSNVLLAHIDSIVLLAEGYSIYAAPPQEIRSYFSNPKIGFSCRPEVDLMDWILDIAAGTERPASQRQADEPSVQQEKFEASPFFSRPKQTGPDALSAFPLSRLRCWGYAQVEPPLVLLHRLGVVLERAFVVKIREYDAIKRGLGGSIFVAVVVGYLQFQIGSFGQYTMSLISYPYVNTSNVTALLFFVGAFLFTQQVLSVQLICSKVNAFRHEQAAGVCSTLSFVLATFVSETPFVVLYAFVFANIIYYMSALGVGYANYFFFTRALCTFSLIGFATAFLLAALLRSEIMVRDAYLVCVFLMVMLSGFPFQLSMIRPAIKDLSVLNPLRWEYEALMSWKFGSAYYKDGEAYLKPYAFGEFDHNDVFAIFGNFLIFALCVALVVLLPLPTLLRPAKASRRSRRSLNYSGDDVEATGPESFDLLYPRTRTVDLTKPLIFARESSLTGSQRLSISLSQTGIEQPSRGPTVAFHNVSYRIKDRKTSAGYKLILDRISGQFDWGKLSCILGAPQSGRSSLLHILAGDRGLRSEVQGSIYYDGAVVSDGPLWQRCALVEAGDEQMPSLTVRETLIFAMQLRCLSRAGLAVVEENVNRTLDLLLLNDQQHTHVKALTAGERRRLSIGEEIVHGPSLLLIDEPETKLNALDASILYRTFREMVNQDKTVIATLHQPSAAVFSLFDTLVLLAGGKVVYHGKASGAVSFFNSSPSAFAFGGYNNPGDFLTDVSGGYIHDSKGCTVSSDALCQHYKASEAYRSVYRRLQQGDTHSLLGKINPDPAGNANPLSDGLSSKDGGESTSSQLVKLSSINGRLIDDEEAEGQLGYMYLFPQVKRNLYKMATSCRCSREELESTLLRAWILLRRAGWALLQRRSIVVGTIAAHVLLACLIGLILGNSSASIYNSVSFFAVGTLLIILGNVQLISMLFQVHQVFLKEHSRGLYSNLLHWSVAALPLYLLRAVNGVLYASIAYELLGLGQGELCVERGLAICPGTLPNFSYSLSLSLSLSLRSQRSAFAGQ